MSETTQPHRGETGRSSKTPKAVVHKKILDAADSDPDASIAELAADVSGASATLVENVLDEYGDPAGDDHDDEGGDASGDDQLDSTPEENTATMATQQPQPDENQAESRTELTDKQRRTLRAIRENPEVTQKELANRFEVSSATISQRVNAIEGFDWTNREECAKNMLENGQQTEEEWSDTHSTQNLSETVDDLNRHVAAIEQLLEERQQSRPQTVFTDPDLVHKIAHACLRSDQITEEEELRIVEGLLTCETNPD